MIESPIAYMLGFIVALVIVHVWKRQRHEWYMRDVHADFHWFLAQYNIDKMRGRVFVQMPRGTYTGARNEAYRLFLHAVEVLEQKEPVDWPV